jgi:L-ascorbate metabolism protein UlaG (beta-lactamase superfamily)
MLMTRLAHAGLKIEAAGHVIVVEPWFPPEVVLQASWFPCPDNIGLLGSSQRPSRYCPTRRAIWPTLEGSAGRNLAVLSTSP